MLLKSNLRPYTAEFSAIGANAEMTRFTLSVHATSCEEAMEIVHWSYREIIGEHGPKLDRTGMRFKYKILHQEEPDRVTAPLAH